MPYFCVECPVKKHATYGRAGGKRTHCSKHGKDLGLVDIVHPTCAEDQCDTTPIYGYPGMRESHCAEHRLANMIDVKHNKCVNDECEARPTFGLPGHIPTHCKKHKLVNEVDVANRQCAVETCNAQPSHGLPGTVPTRCAKHKLANMENIVSKRCRNEDCRKHPSFGFRGNPATCCKKHKDAEMVDVTSNICEHDNCDIHASCGLPGQAATRCGKHRLSNMINVVSKRCAHPGCMSISPRFGFSGKVGTHCVEHKLPNMFDFTNPLCSSCNITRVHHKGNICAPCDQFLKNNGASRRTRQKEMAVIQSLQDAGLLNIDNVHVYEVTFNKSIGTSCGGYRPDILIDCGTFIIIIECDEFQHRSRIIQTAVCDIGADGLEHRSKRLRSVSYDGSCELTRMINIRLAKGVPCHIIRINPDAFKIDGATVRVPIKTRHAALCNQVKMAISTPPSSDLVVTYMYYDDALLQTEIVKLPPGYVWNV